MKASTSITLLLIGLAILVLIPTTWWMGNQMFHLLQMPQVFPPVSGDWLECLPHYWLDRSNIGSNYWPLCHQQAQQYGIGEELTASAKALGVAGAFVLAAIIGLFLIEPQHRIILSGLKLHRGNQAAKYLATAFRRQTRKTRDSKGIKLVDRIVMPSKQELRQWLTIGAMGSGKTVVILTLISRWIERGDKTLALDIQGDFVASLCWPDLKGRMHPALLLNPFDARSGEWWLGSDIESTEDARQFAVKFISVSTSDPFWAKAASNILIGVIKSLQHDLSDRWSWLQLSERINAPVEQLVIWAKEHYTAAIRTLESEGSETADSVLINFSTDFAIIGDIAAYWHDKKDRPRFSVRRWLFGDAENQRMVVMGWDASKKETSRAWASALIDLTGSIIASPTYTKRGRVNLVLDEFSEFEMRMPGVISAIERGRAKNVATVIGVQSPAQLRDVYGTRAEGFTSMIGNHIYVQTSPGKDAEEAARFLGMQTVKDREVSHSTSKNSTSTTVQWVEKQIPVFAPSGFSTKLGPHKHGVRIIYAGIGLDAYMLDFPYPEIVNFRPQFVPAKPIKLSTPAMASPTAQRPTAVSFPSLLKPKG